MLVTPPSGFCPLPRVSPQPPGGSATVRGGPGGSTEAKDLAEQAKVQSLLGIVRAGGVTAAGCEDVGGCGVADQDMAQSGSGVEAMLEAQNPSCANGSRSILSSSLAYIVGPEKRLLAARGGGR